MKNASQRVNSSKFTEWFAPRMTELRQSSSISSSFQLACYHGLSQICSLNTEIHRRTVVGDKDHTWGKPEGLATAYLLPYSDCSLWRGMCVVESTCVGGADFITGVFPN